MRFNRKQTRIITIVICAILVLAMIIPLLITTFS